MHIYDFISKTITQENVKSIIREAGYDPDDYAYEERVDKDGYVVKGEEPMSLTRLENAAKRLKIRVEIYSSITMQNRREMMTTTPYYCDFQNETPDTWTFCVYQTLPSSAGLQSVAWKQTTVPRKGVSGVEWNISYLVATVNYRQIGGKGVYKASQKLSTGLGERWVAKLQDGAQQLFQSGKTPQQDQVIIDNESGLMANLAIGMDGDVSMVKSGVYSGNSAQFIVEPTYWVALFKDLEKGEVISGNQIHGPIQVKFLGGATQLTFRATIQGETFVFEQVGGDRSVAPLDEMYARINWLEAPRAA